MTYNEWIELKTKRMLLDAEKAYDALISDDNDEIQDFIDDQLKAA